ncbi:MAG: TFIIB-type zinc ribbon-containing protein [Myxococcaceae bacterium]|nr:TFIIB-type zinc ribbon-containing protein [Myxococcaceae bacterium]
MNLLACPSCGRSFRSSEVDHSLGIATCGDCGAVMDLRTRSAATDDRLEALTRPPPPRPAIPLPEPFQVNDSGGRFSVSWRWRSLGVAFLAFFAVFWNGFMVVWFSIALATGEWVMAAFGSLHAGVGLFLAYTVVSQLLNSTHITLEQGVLQVKHGPVPAPGGGQWTRADLAQLYGEEVVRNTKNGGRVFSYDLSAMLRDGRRVKLVKGLKDKGQVLWLERALESRLDIVDVPVAGELPKA